VKIALAQTNPLIGAFEQNLAMVLDRIDRAGQAGCRLVIFPELALCGYPPRDLLERPAFVEAHDRALADLVGRVNGTACIVGGLERCPGPGKPLFNSALCIDKGRVVFRARKQLLPTYDVFDEARYFEPGDASTVVVLDGLHFGLTVCEDIWVENSPYARNPVADLKSGCPELDFLVNISASPFHHGKLAERRHLFARICRQHHLPLLYVNQVGGQDSLVFDGHSMVVDATGSVTGAACGFDEHLLFVETGTWKVAGGREPEPDSIGQVLAALVLGLRDYLHKTGFGQAVLGLSGGIDSAVTAAIACRALGPENVLCVSLPSPYTSEASVEDARQLAANLGCAFRLMPIEPAMRAYGDILAPLFAGRDEDVTEQNLQARIRGNLLMALSNKFGSLLLATGNKSEMAVGYCTLYGDMSGGLAVLADVPKVMVYELARHLNRERQVIPGRILTRPPTAELKPGQLDQDDLPPYEILDPILAAYLEEQLGIDEIVGRGFDRRTVEDVVRRIRVNEFKRQQAPLGIKVTSKAFGYGRRYPVAQGFAG